MAPRHVQKKQSGEGQYKDRAALRRQGKDDEYKDVSLHRPGFGRRQADKLGGGYVGGLRKAKSRSRGRRDCEYQ